MSEKGGSYRYGWCHQEKIGMHKKVINNIRPFINVSQLMIADLEL